MVLYYGIRRVSIFNHNNQIKRIKNRAGDDVYKDWTKQAEYSCETAQYPQMPSTAAKKEYIDTETSAITSKLTKTVLIIVPFTKVFSFILHSPLLC